MAIVYILTALVIVLVSLICVLVYLLKQMIKDFMYYVSTKQEVSLPSVKEELKIDTTSTEPETAIDLLEAFDRDKDHIDAPVKKFDHAMDALRYMIMSKPF